MKGTKYKHKENLGQMTDDIINLKDNSLLNTKKLEYLIILKNLLFLIILVFILM